MTKSTAAPTMIRAFMPLWKAAEQMGALMFIHQGEQPWSESAPNRYHLPNTIGNLADPGGDVCLRSSSAG